MEFMGKKLSLNTKAKIQLEEKLGASPLTFIFDMAGAVGADGEVDITEMKLPPMKFYVILLHSALQRFNHGMGTEEVMELIDDYLEQDGNSVMSLMNLAMELLKEARYITEEAVEEPIVVEEPVAPKKPRAKKSTSTTKPTE